MQRVVLVAVRNRIGRQVRSTCRGDRERVTSFVVDMAGMATDPFERDAVMLAELEQLSP